MNHSIIEANENNGRPCIGQWPTAIIDNTMQAWIIENIDDKIERKIVQFLEDVRRRHISRIRRQKNPILFTFCHNHFSLFLLIHQIIDPSDIFLDMIAKFALFPLYSHNFTPQTCYETIPKQCDRV